MPKKWNILPPCPEDFSRSLLHLPPVFPQLLWHRGIRNTDDIRLFFEPEYERDVHDPFLFRDMRKAVARTFQALEQGERIVVFGDYDADGLTGSTVLLETLTEIGNKVAPNNVHIASYIPHRDKEGYGLQMENTELLIKEGARVIITVDCGIACVNEIARAREAGVDVIVVDHHQFGDVLPDAILIHPGLPGEPYPFSSLAAVGVAWKFASALIREAEDRGITLPPGYAKWLLDLVSIATVTDMVPLIGENRVLEKYGLTVLNKTRRPGLRALMERGALQLGAVGVRDIGFVIGPRLNAASRMDHALLALHLLRASTAEDAAARATDIEMLNRARQELMARMMEEADAMLASMPAHANIHVFHQPHWSPALVGLVAGRMSDRFGMPVVAVGKHGRQWIGSGRSLPFYNITEAVKRAGKGLLTRSGGHVQACGFALDRDEDVPIFAERLRQDANTNVSSKDIGPCIDIHAELPLSMASLELSSALRQFEPFGVGNPEPVFYAKNIEILATDTIGQNNKHLRIIGSDGTLAQKCIAFGFGARADEARPGMHIDVAYTLGVNEWNGRREVQCKVVDFRDAAPPCSMQQTSKKDSLTEERLAKAGLI